MTAAVTPVAILLVLFVVALMLFATEWLPVDVTALLLLGALLLVGAGVATVLAKRRLS